MTATVLSRDLVSESGARKSGKLYTELGLKGLLYLAYNCVPSEHMAQESPLAVEKKTLKMDGCFFS